MTELIEILAYPFVIRALLTGSILVLACSLVGSVLVNKRLALLTQSLANVAFLGVALAMTFNLPNIPSSLALVSLTSYHVFQRKESKKLLTDSLLALLSNVALALGICLIAYTRGLSLDICNFMFGSVLVIEQGEMYAILLLCLLVILAYFYLRPYLFAWQIDAPFYVRTKLLPKSLNLLLALLLSCLLAAGLKIMGTLLLSSLLLLPALTAKLLAKTNKQAQIFSLLLALLGFYLGLAVSYAFYLPSGAAIVALYACLYLLAKLVVKLSKRRYKLLVGIFSLFLLVTLAACQKKTERAESLTNLFASNKSPFTTDVANEQVMPNFNRKLGRDKTSSLRTERLPSGKAQDGSEYLPIKEKQFVLLTNEIYANYKNYLTQTIAYEGVFVSLYDKDIAMNRYFVIRYGPGCCAYDGMPGFEVKFPKDYAVSKLEANEWLYVEGKLKISHEDKSDYLYIAVQKVERERPEGLLNVKH